jgi:nitrate reductase / nitrite oxidoreductase, alpha subunit
VVRSTHGVNCTGGCSWQIYVKNGIVTWEMQGLDYPEISAELPPYEPRGCQRGISCSWYLYSPLRVKYPYVRGVLLDLWTAARERHADPVEAWRSLVEDPDARARDGSARRGKGGLRRASGTRCSSSSPPRRSTRSRSTGRTASPVSPRSPRCR